MHYCSTLSRSDDSPLWAGLKAFSWEFGKQATVIVTDEIPGIAQAKAADKLINNRNLAAGELELGTLDRASSVLDLVPGGSLFNRAAKGFGGVGSLFAKRADHVLARGARRAASHAALRQKRTRPPRRCSPRPWTRPTT